MILPDFFPGYQRWFPSVSKWCIQKETINVLEDYFGASGGQIFWETMWMQMQVSMLQEQRAKSKEKKRKNSRTDRGRFTTLGQTNSPADRLSLVRETATNANSLWISLASQPLSTRPWRPSSPWNLPRADRHPPTHTHTRRQIAKRTRPRLISMRLSITFVHKRKRIQYFIES